MQCSGCFDFITIYEQYKVCTTSNDNGANKSNKGTYTKKKKQILSISLTLTLFLLINAQLLMVLYNET